MLTDEMLLDSYHLAIQLRLESDFITLLLTEIHKRNLGFII
ncbi:sporulation inhibitor sda [Paenibacillus crassostreae]|uniref:Sporulation inhibitor sda n=1 Tax=Paenibacillus crassostreae TaxID=1763538 RepID=A0A167GUG7_9BACL|nr:sporulation inhibitor sda [Paenibacillus crassostreae]OAB77919.1 sporulation inhibitor sda [Paenibacillus crassostreae]